MTTNTTFITSNKNDFKMDYYLYKDSFGEDIKSVSYLDVSEGTLKNPIIKYKPLPKDIKRLISRGDKTFTSRIYFISAEEREIYCGYNNGLCYKLTKTPISKKANRVQLITDTESRTCIILSDKFFEFIKNHNELILPNRNPNAGRPKGSSALL